VQRECTKPSLIAAQANTQQSIYYSSTFLQAASADHSSFDITWQEVQNALVAILATTGF